MKFLDFFKLYTEEVSDNLKSKDPNEIWKVAQDIRKNPGDYDREDIAAIIYRLINPRCSFFKDNGSIIIISSENIYKTTSLSGKLDYEIISMKFYNILRSIDNLTKEIEFQKSRRTRSLDTREIDRFISEMEVKIKQKKKIRDTAEKAVTDDDLIKVFKHYNITVPQIYQQLIRDTYELPKHPNELPKEYQHLPEEMLSRIVNDSTTPIEFAIDSTYRHELVEWVDYFSNITILDYRQDIDQYGPKKKEAFGWLTMISEKMKLMMDHVRRIAPKDKKVDHEFTLLMDKKFPAFQDYLMDLTTKSIFGIDIFEYRNQHNMHHLSFSCWHTFRWFLYNIKSTYFTKAQIVFGPANARETFIPLEKIVKIQPQDLTNGLKTSPAKAFEHAAEREAKEWEKNNKTLEFTKYPREYVDTDHARMIRNTANLKAEGQRLDHCVGGYGPSCISGRSLIIRLPNSTAELDPSSLRIFQHYASRNSAPSDIDRQYLQEWIDANL